MTKSLVVAIEPDRNQAARLSGIVRTRLGAELVLAESAARALATLGDRVPDLILTPALLSARDEAALAGRLRELGPSAAHVQTVTLPQLGGAIPDQSPRGMFERFRRSRPAPASTEGCDPEVFAQQVSAYLQRAQVERASANISAIEQTHVPVVAPAPVTFVDQASLPAVERTALQVSEPEVAAFIDEYLAQPPIDEVAETGPAFEAIEQELPAAASFEPAEFQHPVAAMSEPVLASAEPVEVISEPIAAMAEIHESAEELSDAAAILPELVETFVAPAAIIEDVVEPPPLVEAFVESPVVVDAFLAPALAVEEFIEPGPVSVEMFDSVAVADEKWIVPEPVVDAFVALPPVVEEMIEPERSVEQMIGPERIVDEAIEPEPIQAPLAAAAQSDPAFSVDDIELEFWIADEPAAAPVEATVLAQAPPVDDRIDTAAQDGNDIDMSSFLEGLVLPPVEPATPPAAAAAERPVAAAPTPPEPTPFPGPRRTQPKRPVPVHEHRVLEHKPARRKVNPPAQDEWGLFDPQQCGFAALVAKLDAVTEDETAEKQRGTARLISYN